MVLAQGEQTGKEQRGWETDPGLSANLTYDKWHFEFVGKKVKLNKWYWDNMLPYLEKKIKSRSLICIETKYKLNT